MENKKQSGIILLIVVIIFSALFITILGRFMFIQVTGEVQSVDLVSYSEKYREANSTLTAERGKIYDRSGMTLADNRPVYKLYAILRESYSENSPTPLHVEDINETAEQLAPYLDMDVSSIRSILENGRENDQFQVEFGTNGNRLSKEEKEEIESLNLPGINFEGHLERYYPNGLYASQVIGFTERGEESLKGAYGIESELDEYLQGTDGFVKYYQDSYGYQLLNAEETVQSPENGDHVELTIDQKIQTFLEDALTSVEETYDPERVMAAVMDPNTGEILAMSNRPTFDPNTRENIENWYNDIISTPFELGSTLKIFSLAAAIEEGVYDGEDTFKSGQYRINENFRPVRDHDRDGWGVITYDEGVMRSSNVAFAKLLWEELGPDSFLDYLHDFHFDRLTEIDLSGEELGVIQYRYPMEQITTSFGQGSTFTPIQLMKATTALANEGEMVRPYVVSSITDSTTGELLHQNETETVGQPISPETVDEVVELLEESVTSDIGTGRRFALDDFTSFGKTGTAQIPDSESGGYLTSHNDYVFSYIGMAPSEEPELMMYVAVKQPDVDYYNEGGLTTSYIYRTVMENSLHYLEVTPDQDQEQSVEAIGLEQVDGEPVDEVKEQLESSHLKVEVIGDGEKVESIWPNTGSQVLQNQRVLLLTDGQMTMPDLTGWSLREVLALGQLTDIKIDYIGTGFVTDQSIEMNSTFSQDRILVVELNEREEKDATEESEDPEFEIE
ncbi:penicillin-binding protein [Alkalibacillus aidingensis]|uniref:penicillin-binding protein n=1 Tax=Alkalibacillus aidingensis TaxID=2747607 RepID=UPI00166126FF|nr:penicillin-binding protein [Alkalibacillus aidingensis]